MHFIYYKIALSVIYTVEIYKVVLKFQKNPEPEL